jgi:hypothetical protein
MFGDHPFGKSADKNSPVVCCPACKSTEFEAKQNQWENFRICLKCGNKWSGGIGFDITMSPNHPEVRPQGVPVPEDDVPDVQYTGASFRDPNKNW